LVARKKPGQKKKNPQRGRGETNGRQISFHGLFATIFAILRPTYFQSINKLLTTPVAHPSSLYGHEINRSLRIRQVKKKIFCFIFSKYHILYKHI
jgi:hypothetical protein